MTDPPPYMRIVDDVRRRIAAGTLAPGDRVPSTRQLTRDWGVAMATATKALATLRQEGLVRAVRGMGTVVAPPARSTPGAPPPRAPRSTPGGTTASAPLTQDSVVRAAVRIADAESTGALTMRRIATDCGVAAMSLYRHVPDKDTLLALMADAVFVANPLPEPAPPGWRASLEAAARLEWRMYRQHLWLAQVVSFTRPVLMPAAMDHTEWMMRAVDGLGIDLVTMSRIVIMISNHVRASAVLLGAEYEAELDSGVTAEQWRQSAASTVQELFASGRYPLLASLDTVPEGAPDPESVFEFGLRRLLDGLEAIIPR